MISISARTKLTEGQLKQTDKEKSLWDFLPEDPKNLAYFLSAFTFKKDYTAYNLVPQIFSFVKKIVDLEQVDDESGFEEPGELLKGVEALKLINLDVIIKEFLNPDMISAEKALKLLNGLEEYLKYQQSQGKLVRLEWC